MKSTVCFICTFHLVVLSIFLLKKYKVWLEMLSPGTPVLVHSLPAKSSNRLDDDALDIFATHSSLVYDITDTDC